MSGLKKFFKKKSPSAKNSRSAEDLSDAASIASGYTISKDKDLPKLHKAVLSGDLSKVKQLVKKGDINQLDRENRTALHLACAQGKEDIVKFLLENNAKTNLCDNYGRTPLMKVVECQFLECIKILLEHGAQANVVDVNNSTSLHLAAANGDIDAAVLLLEREAKVDAKDKEGFTPLHVSSSLGNLSFVNFLISEGANIDEVDAHGRSAVMTAASEGHISIVQLFFQYNANTELKDSRGWKASDHAVIHGHHSVSNIIEEYEEQQERARNQAKNTKSNQSTPNKRVDFTGLLGAATTTNDENFSFGGPVADEGGYTSASAKEEDSVSQARLQCHLRQLARGMALFRSSGYIGGKWKDCDAKFPVYNPATGQELGRVADMGRNDAEEAVNKAYDAFKVWKNVTTKERSQKLRNWYNLIVQHEGELAELLTTEQGKPLFEAKGEVRYAASYVEWFAEEAKRIYGDIIPSPHPSRRLFSLKQPVGVAALWTPWNFPVAMITRKVAAALAAGCTVIIKPSEETPYCALALQKLAEDAGFPAGVINTIPCSRDHVDQVTDALLGNDLVAKMSFTGSTATGKLLLSKCVDPIKRVSLELGGNAPFIIFNSANIDAAVEGAITAKFRHTAQTCICANRILVQDKIYDEFAARFAAAVDKQMKVGNGMEASSTQGPLINEKAVQKVETHVKDALSKGAKCLRGGQRHELGGNFFQPTILTDVSRDMIICSQETFGPVAPLIRFKTEEEAVAVGNDTSSGLAGYFFSQDMSQIWRVAEAMDVGMVGINEGIISSEIAPFGGWKQSGLGREGSKYGIEEYLEIKYICLGGINQS